MLLPGSEASAAQTQACSNSDQCLHDLLRPGQKYMSQTKTNGTTQSVCWAHLPGMHMLRRPKIAAALMPGVLLCPHLGHMHLLTHGILYMAGS